MFLPQNPRPDAVDPLAVAAETDDPAYEIIPGGMGRGVIILCDHASNAMPAEFANLGLDAASLERHAAYDIGAETMTRVCAAALGAPAVLTRFSRLLCDPNRGDDDPTLAPALTDIGIVPGNVRLSDQDVQARLDRFSRPYHRAIDRQIGRFLAQGIIPALYSIHSFTPVMKGVPRRCHVGVLWDSDQRFTAPLLEQFAQDKTIVVAGNEPYDGALAGSTLDRHATARGLPAAMIEIRQDLVATWETAAAWGNRLAEAVEPILGQAALHHIQPGPSRCRSVRKEGTGHA